VRSARARRIQKWMPMKIEYEIIQNEQLDDPIRDVFATLLRKQGKVQGDFSKKADRCKIVGIARFDGTAVAIGGIKKKTESDFSNEKAGIPDLAKAFDWELGYLYTEADQCGRGIASTLARLLVDAYGPGNLMASTEIAANPAMVRILEKLGFRLFGKPWTSGIHDNYLGLFLNFQGNSRGPLGSIIEERRR